MGRRSADIKGSKQIPHLWIREISFLVNSVAEGLEENNSVVNILKKKHNY